jgi:prevent-host-death family protein
MATAGEEALSMVRTMTSDDLRTNIDDVIRSVRETQEPVLLEDDSVVLISQEEYERLQRAKLEYAWSVIQRVKDRNADKDPDEVFADVTAIVEQVRRERYERSQQDSSCSH